PRADDAAAGHRPGPGAGLPRRPGGARRRRPRHGAGGAGGLAGRVLGERVDRDAGRAGGGRRPGRRAGAGRGPPARPAPPLTGHGARRVRRRPARRARRQPTRAWDSWAWRARWATSRWSATMRRWSAAEPKSRASASARPTHRSSGSPSGPVVPPHTSTAVRVTSRWHSPTAALATDAASGALASPDATAAVAW